ncbi:uncharacterized protein LOC143211164 [Lasioglossum baleicum]|uniref:uncharacterized protein LOC143211164 n=1 Tax=Lasioglossum baleicum TaxID=434251 RepID=UPI003FCCBC5E
MAFFQLALKARKLEKAMRRYEDEKLRSIEISAGAKPRYTLKQRIRRQKLRLKKKVKGLCGKIFAIPKRSWIYKKIVEARTDGTLENYVAKSFLGFIGGIFLTYIFFGFFVLQLGYKLSSATFLCTAIGVVLTLGLAFSPRVRCMVFLLLPQFFSKRGRQALVAYAFILALTGPVKNTVHNTSVLTESLACAQEQLKEAVKTVIDLAKQPFYALKDAISKVIKSVKAVVKRIKQTLLAIKRLVLSILRVITSVFQWLGSVINMCNKKLGTPFDRCQSVFEGAVADCKAKLGPFFGLVCNVTYVVSTLCYIVKPLDFICMLVSYVSDAVVGAVKRKVKRFTMHMKAMFYVKVKFSHSFDFETNQSKSLGDVSAGIATEIRSRTDTLFSIFSSIGFVTSLFVFIIVLRVMRYRFKWMTSERFDNKYITDDLRTIDIIRTRQDKETVLPLNPRERNKYVPLSSVKLIKSEKTKLVRSAVFLGLATIKLMSYLTIDYSLYWVLNTIQIHGRYQSKVEKPSVVSIHVAGEGYMADLYRSIIKSFTPHGKESEINTMLCLPQPVPPDMDKYTQIIALIILCWMVAVFEPYGLRLRHVVLCQYYPDRAKQRATWLYNHIIRSRGNFLKFARRQLRRKFGLAGGEKIEKVTLQDRLWAVCPFLNILFPRKQKMCLLCGAVERSDVDPHIKCATPGCVGLYCPPCFADLQNICTICRSPVEYGDLSDLSEEKDSSEDEYPIVKKKPEEEPEEVVGEEEVEKFDEEEEEEWGEEEYVGGEYEAETEEETGEGEEEDAVGEEAGEEEQLEEEEEVGELTEEEKKEKKIKRKKLKELEETEVEKETAQQTEERYEEDSDSAYSYTYQDEPSEDTKMVKHRDPFRDVEAQKIRDDVTIQIFNEPLVREPCSCDESPTSCFVVRARRKIRARLKKKPDHRGRDSDSSCSTEEVDEEEVIHVEVDDECEELLEKDRRDNEKRGRINKIVGAVAKIPWLGRGEVRAPSESCNSRMSSFLIFLRYSFWNPLREIWKFTVYIGGGQPYSLLGLENGGNVPQVDHPNLHPSNSRQLSCERWQDDRKPSRGLQTRRPSLMSKIVGMLQGKPKLPLHTYKRSRKIKDSSSSSSSSCDENEILLRDDDRSDCGHLMRRRTRKLEDDDIESFDFRHPRDTKFPTKQLPKYLESEVKCTSYYEVDETDSQGNCVQVEDVNQSSDAMRRGKRHWRDATEDDEFVGPCSCTSDVTQDAAKDADLYSMEISTEQMDSSKTLIDSEIEKSSSATRSDAEYTEDTGSSSMIVEEPAGKDIFDDSSEFEDIDESGETKGETGVSEGSQEDYRRRSTIEKEVKRTSMSRKNDDDYELKRNDRVRREAGGADEGIEEEGEQLEDPKGKRKDFKKTMMRIGKLRELYSKRKAAKSDTKEALQPQDSNEVEDGKKKKKIVDKLKVLTGKARRSDKKKRGERSEQKETEEVPEKLEEPMTSDNKKEKKEKAETQDVKEEREKSDQKEIQEEEKPEEPGPEEKSVVDIDETKEKTEESQLEVQETEPVEEDKKKKVSIDSKAEVLKIDRATDLPDRSRHTQTKLPKRDSKKILEEEIELPDAGESEKEREKKRKSSERKKDHRERYKEDKSPKDRKRRSSKKDDEEYYSVKDKDGERKRKSRLPYKEELARRTKRKCSKDRRHEDASEERRRRRCSILEEEPQIYHRRYAEHPQCSCGMDHRHERVCPPTIAHERTCRCHPYQRPYSEPQRDMYGHSRDHPEQVERGFEMPMVKKYLPMYQTPELIEELKAHDRMKLIREREAMRKSPRSARTSPRFKMAPRGAAPCYFPGTSKSVDKDAKLAYQETQAYRNVLCEFAKRTSRRKQEDTTPLIHLSKKADKTKRVKQLYPPESRSAKARRFADRVIASFKLQASAPLRDLLQAEDRVHLQNGMPPKKASEVDGLPLLRQSSGKLHLQGTDKEMLLLRLGSGPVLLRGEPDELPSRKTGRIGA